MYKQHYLNSIIIFSLTHFASSSLRCTLRVVVYSVALISAVTWLHSHAVVPGLRCWPCMLAEVSFSFFFFSLLSRAFKKACFEQMLLSILRRLFFDGKWFKNPQTTSRRFFWKKKSLSLKDYKMTPFCASLSKYISCVRIAKWALSNSDFLSIFTSERTEPHPSQVC